MFSDKTYDCLKKIAQIWIPAIGALYFGLSQIWTGLPYPSEIVGTLTCIDTFIGAVLGLSSEAYYEKEDQNGKV